MTIPIAQDPFGFECFGVQETALPDRIAIQAEDCPKLTRGGNLPHAGRSGFWELPAAVSRSEGMKERLRYLLAGDSESRVWERTPALPLPAVARKAADYTGTEIGGGHDQDEDALGLFFAVQSHGDSLHRLFDRSSNDPSVVATPEAIWFPSRVVLEEMRREIRRETEPPVATIIKVQQRLERPLQELCGALRRILQRRRKMVPIALAETVDAGCVEWLAKQPGRTLKERAGSRQEILAVVREETVDTFENRVLKECLRLCEEEARRYISNFGPRFGDHDRVKTVKRFLRQVSAMLHLEEMEQIGELSDDSRPNYVLQYAPRYCDVWWAYQLLKQRRRAEDDLWRWRHRIWSEILLVDLAVATEDLAGPDVARADREIGLLRDPQNGFWIHGASRLPVFPIHYKGHDVYVSLEMPLHSAFVSTQPECGPCDVLVTVRCHPAESDPWRAEVVSCAEFLPLSLGQTSGPLRLVLRPERSAEQKTEPGELLSEGALRSQVLSWPIWGPDRIKCAQLVLSGMVDLALERG